MIAKLVPSFLQVDHTLFLRGCSDIGLTLNEEQISAFESFERALYEANETANLTRIPETECWRLHFLDSLLFADLLPVGATVLDLGTGPGFPAWPLAYARPDLKISALDSNLKMLGFLRSQPLKNLRIIEGRAEDYKSREKFDVVTGRALAPLSIQLELSARPCRIGGIVLPMRTSRDVLVKLSILGLKLGAVHRRVLPGTDAMRVFPSYAKTSATPTEYPRRWAEIKAKPL